MYFADDGHKERLDNAIWDSGAVRRNGRVDSYYGASLYLLTGSEGMWERLRQYVHPGNMDFVKMLDCGLTEDEDIIVRLAGNFYNGNFWETLTPWDMICRLGSENAELVLGAFRLRLRTFTLEELSGAAENEKNG